MNGKTGNKGPGQDWSVEISACGPPQPCLIQVSIIQLLFFVSSSAILFNDTDLHYAFADPEDLA